MNTGLIDELKTIADGFDEAGCVRFASIVDEIAMTVLAAETILPPKDDMAGDIAPPQDEGAMGDPMAENATGSQNPPLATSTMDVNSLHKENLSLKQQVAMLSQKLKQIGQQGEQNYANAAPSNIPALT